MRSRRLWTTSTSAVVKPLRDYRERTQFIMITHQKRTMEAADVLYGVTMGPDGASQVVSARMAEAAIDREESAKGRAKAMPAADAPCKGASRGVA